MRVLSLNLRGGGGPRVVRIADYVAASGADVFVAGEFVPGPRGDALIERLRAAGFTSFRTPSRPRERYTVLLASRSLAAAVRTGVAPRDRGRLVAARCAGVMIVGVYFDHNRDKASLFDYLLSRPPVLGDECLAIGDWNTGLHHLDEAGATFTCADRFALMERRGFVDLWRARHGPDAREVSWASARGAGYRIDHAFATDAVARRVTRCDYDHATRDALSDHSALIVDLAA